MQESNNFYCDNFYTSLHVVMKVQCKELPKHTYKKSSKASANKKRKIIKYGCIHIKSSIKITEMGITFQRKSSKAEVTLNKSDAWK
jgi:hypothetical protein